MADLKAAAKRKKKAKHKGPIEDLMESLRQRIRELNAEIAVRDNMGNEVLRILRDATGKRDFHSEMEGAEYAARLLAEARRDGARLDFAEKYRLDIRSNAMTGKVDVSTAEFHPCHRRLFSHKTLRGAIDKAMENGK